MTKFFNKFKKPCLGAFFGLFSRFLGQFFFSPKHPALSRTISNGFVAPCRNLEKTKDTIPRKQPDRQDGRTDGGMDGSLGGSYFMGPFWLPPEVQKKQKSIYIK